MSEVIDIGVPGTAPSLSETQQRWGFRFMMLSVMLGVISEEVFSGNILTILALNLGAREWHIGLLGFIIFGSSLSQIFVVGLAQRVSKKKLVIAVFGLMLLFSMPMLALGAPALRSKVSAALGLLIGCVAVRQITASVLTPSWMGLLRDMTPVQARGRLLGLLRSSWQTVLMLTLVFTGFYLGPHPAWGRLQNTILVGLITLLLRTLILLPVASPPVTGKGQRAGWWRMILAPMHDRAFRPFLLYTLFYGLAFGLEEGFRIVYLVRLGFGQNLALICAGLTALGAAVTLIAWGRLADRFGNRGVFSLTLAGFAGCVLLWLCVTGRPWGLVLAMVLFFAAGAFNGGNSLVHTRYLFASLKPELEAPYIAVTYLVLQQASGLGALLSGQILTHAEQWGLTPTRPGLNNYRLIFFLSAMVFLIPWSLRLRLREPGEAPTRHLLTAIFRSVRTFGKRIKNQRPD